MTKITNADAEYVMSYLVAEFRGNNFPHPGTWEYGQRLCPSGINPAEQSIVYLCIYLPEFDPQVWKSYTHNMGSISCTLQKTIKELVHNSLNTTSDIPEEALANINRITKFFANKIRWYVMSYYIQTDELISLEAFTRLVDSFLPEVNKQANKQVLGQLIS